MNFYQGNANKSRHDEKGYILLVLLLFISLLAIGFLGMIQKIDFEIRRDREEEMIHRGVQYSRAVRNFINKFRRYPVSIEELENTNNIRFLRKRYKDPITGKDFKVLHLSDMPGYIKTSGAGVPVASLAQQQQGPRGVSGNVAAATGGPVIDTAEVQGPELNPQTEGSRQSPDSQADASQNDISGTAAVAQPLAPLPVPNAAFQSGGGLVIGVASTSKQKTMREFNKKNHYNQWLFIYDPGTDRMGLIMTPNQPPLRVASQINQNGEAAQQASGSGPSPSAPPGSARRQQ